VQAFLEPISGVARVSRLLAGFPAPVPAGPQVMEFTIGSTLLPPPSSPACIAARAWLAAAMMCRCRSECGSTAPSSPSPHGHDAIRITHDARTR